MTSTALEDALGEIFDLALEEPEEGLTFWSFHERDRATPLDYDEVLARLASGEGVYAIELVFDEALELYQRGAGRRVADARALLALKSERVDALAKAPPLPKATLPVASSTKRGPLHGALLAQQIDDDAAERPKKKASSAARAAAKKSASSTTKRS